MSATSSATSGGMSASSRAPATARAGTVGAPLLPPGRLGHAALPFLAPIMYSPSTSSLASAAGMTTANLPRYITAIAIRQREHLVELGADTSRIALPCVARLDAAARE